MKQVELSNKLKVQDLVRRLANEEIVITKGGRAVAMLHGFDEDDLAWYERERDPIFIDSISKARQQIQRGESIGLEELKEKLGIHESLDSFLWKEVDRLLGDGKNGERSWTRLRRLCLEVVDAERQALFRKHFRKRSCGIRYEKISQSALARLTSKLRPDHDRQPPRNADEPLIIVEHKKKKFLVDGKRRRTLWLKEKRKGPFPAIIIRFDFDG